MRKIFFYIATVLVVTCTQTYGTTRILDLKKPVETVLHKGVSVTRIEEEKGKLAYKHWTPSNREREEAENSYIDHDGVINGQRYMEFKEEATIHADYIENPINLTYANKKANTGPAVVEMLIVVDKEFGDVFQHDQVKILEYWTAFFKDMNLRYKTLPSVDISFKITEIVAIATLSGQPFIEDARGADGRAEYGRILRLFRQWVVDEKSKFKKFDLAICVTNTRLISYGGLAYVPSACAGVGSAVFSDAGKWRSASLGAHEIAHTLGAPHDASIEGCTAKGYIMSGNSDKLRWYFSSCSDEKIHAFVSSDQAACLKRIDETGSTPISEGIFPPPMVEQCRQEYGPDAWMKEEDDYSCTKIKCLFPRDGHVYISNLETAENSPCLEGGHCFRGKCRMEGSLIQNVGSGLCMTTADQFSSYVAAKLTNCPTEPTPLNTFVISDTNGWKMLATPWWSVDASESGDKCIWTGYSDGDTVWTARCDATDVHQRWDFIAVGDGEFMLSHRLTKRCARQLPHSSYIKTYKTCDRSDATMRWKIL